MTFAGFLVWISEERRRGRKAVVRRETEVMFVLNVWWKDSRVSERDPDFWGGMAMPALFTSTPNHQHNPFICVAIRCTY